MKLSTIVVCSVALTAPSAAFTVQADEGSVTLYGQARVSVDVTDNDQGRITNVSNGESRLGIKGTESLGSGLKAVFQFEVNANVDDGAGTTGTFFGTARDSYVGLAGNFGTVALGILNTPYRESSDSIDVFNNSLGDYNSIIGEVGNKDTRAEFNRREPNTINYWSPKLSGFQFKGQYRVDELASVDQDRYSVAGTYENGPWFGSLAYEKHLNETSTSTADTDGIKVGVAYAFNEAKTRVGFVYEMLSQEGKGIFDRDAWYVSLSHKIGNNTFKAAYARASDNDLIDDSGANFFVLGLTHTLSKRTEVFGLYARTNNDTNGGYDIGNSTSGTTAAPFNGATLSSFSVGMNHKF